MEQARRLVSPGLESILLITALGFCNGITGSCRYYLDRAFSVVNECFAKLDTSSDGYGVVPPLKTLLEGVEMTEK
ncbi:hypothetical protein Tco_0911856 [Tanacetum coccineum]